MCAAEDKNTTEKLRLFKASVQTHPGKLKRLQCRVLIPMFQKKIWCLCFDFHLRAVPGGVAVWMWVSRRAGAALVEQPDTRGPRVTAGCVGCWWRFCLAGSSRGSGFPDDLYLSLCNGDVFLKSSSCTMGSMGLAVF